MLSVSQLSFIAGANHLLHEVSFQLPQGSFLCIVGANGAGKSLLTRHLAALLPSSSGVICWKNKDINTFSDKKRASLISYLAPHETENAPFTVMETVLSGLYPALGYFNSNSPYHYTLAQGYLQQLGLEGFEERLFASLSSGEKALVLLARTLMQDTELIILDEASANLDMAREQLFFDYLRRLTPHKTIISVVHNLSLASSYATHILALKKGEVVGFGLVDALFTAKTIKDCFGFEALLIPCQQQKGFHLEVQKEFYSGKRLDYPPEKD